MTRPLDSLTEALLTAAREPLLAPYRWRGGVVGAFEQEHAIDPLEASRVRLLVERAHDAAAHPGDTAVDSQAREAEQDRAYTR